MCLQSQSLDQELEEAEGQHLQAYHGHMRCMDVLLQLNAARSTFIQQQFNTNVKVILIHFSSSVYYLIYNMSRLPICALCK